MNGMEMLSTFYWIQWRRKQGGKVLFYVLEREKQSEEREYAKFWFKKKKEHDK